METAERVLSHITACVLNYAEQDHTLCSLCDTILQHAKELTQSEHAILGGIEYDCEGQPAACPCFSIGADHPFRHDILSMGAGMQSAFRRCIDSNSVVLLDETVSVPEGHIPVKAAAIVPLRFRGRPSALIGLANPKEPYSREKLDALAPFFVVVANILASFRLNEEMLQEKEQMVKLAESVADAKDSFLAKVSHEIRTPLNGIVGMTRVLLNMSLSQNVRQKVNIINECSYQLISQVDDLLDYSKMTCGKLKLTPTAVCVRSCVEKAFDVIAAKASEKQLTINSIVDTDVPAYIMVDSKRLRQILVILLSNAVKFTDKGYIVARVKELLPPPGEGLHRLQIDVEDTGMGIPPEEHKLIFDTFTQGGNSCMTDGAGLGLAICSKLVELMDGSISVHSQMGRGSCFTVIITVASANMPQEDVGCYLTSLQGMRALIVDDKVLNQVVLCNMLQRWGLSSVMCDSGSAALQYLKSGMVFDIGFVDIQMPHMNGYELAERIKQSTSHYFPLIAVSSVDCWTSSTDNHSRFTLTLQKPLKQNAVYDAILRVLHPTQQRRQSLPLAIPRELRILVAEDSDSNQKVIESLLQQLGYDHVTIVENGLQAVRMQKEEHFDVILMDLKMPIMNGFDAARRIRKHFPSAPPTIVALSAMVLDKDKEQAKQCGMEHFIGKPVDMDLLDQVLRHVTIQK